PSICIAPWAVCHWRSKPRSQKRQEHQFDEGGPCDDAPHASLAQGNPGGLFFGSHVPQTTPQARPVTQDQWLNRFVAALLAFAVVGGTARSADVPSPSPEKLRLLTRFFED